MPTTRPLIAGAALLLAAAAPFAQSEAATGRGPGAAPSGLAVYDPQAEIAFNHYYDPYYRDRYYRRNRTRTGDVIAGVVLVGVLAAVLASRSRSRDRDEDRDYRTRQRGYRSGNGVEGAVEACVDAAERDGRVETIDSARRDAQGWVVEGRLSTGGRFTCELDRTGRVRAIDIDRTRDYQDRGARTRDDEYYEDARARRGEPMAPEARESPLRTWDFEDSADAPAYAAGD